MHESSHVTRIENVTVWTGTPQADGSILTSDCCALRDGFVLAIGDAAREMEADDVIDAAGGFLMPAFADGHVHPIFAGVERAFAAVRECSSVGEVADAVRAWANEHPHAEWIRGEGFDPSLAPGGLFQATWLDAVVSDRPVVLRASDYHTVWVNSAALARVGYVRGVAQPPDGEIVLDENSFPMGTLREWGAWRPVYARMPALTVDDMVEALDYSTGLLRAAGITWIQDAWVEPRDIEGWLAAVASDRAHVDVDLALWADPTRWRDQLDEFVELRSKVKGSGLKGITANTIKFFADGVIESSTGSLLEPYCDCPHSKGLPNWQPDELKWAMSAIDERGFHPHVHAIGDAAVRVALDAIEFTRATNPIRDRRPTVCHLQLVDETDLPRFAELGVIANFEPFWAQLDPWQDTLTIPRLGEHRAHRQYQMRTMLASGARVSFGSDWPVTTYDPLKGIRMAVSRQADDAQEPWMPHECLSVDQALRAYTDGVAYQSGRSDAGRIEPGMKADLVLLSEDPRMVSPVNLADIDVVRVWRSSTAGG